jgi:hypothetical protein
LDRCCFSPGSFAPTSSPFYPAPPQTTSSLLVTTRPCRLRSPRYTATSHFSNIGSPILHLSRVVVAHRLALSTQTLQVDPETGVITGEVETIALCGGVRSGVRNSLPPSPPPSTLHPPRRFLTPTHSSGLPFPSLLPRAILTTASTCWRRRLASSTSKFSSPSQRAGHNSHLNAHVFSSSPLPLSTAFSRPAKGIDWQDRRVQEGDEQCRVFFRNGVTHRIS